MRRIIRLLYCLIVLSSCAFPVCAKQIDTLRVSSTLTTHIVFSDALSYVDISMPDKVMAAVVENNKNIIALRADAPFVGSLNITALENGQTIHSFIVFYDPSPDCLVLDMREDPASTASAAIAAVGNEAQAEELSPLERIHDQKRSLYHLGDKQYGIEVYCENITIEDDVLYFTLSLSNRSGVSYDMDDAVFKIESIQSGRKSLQLENRITPISSIGSLSAKDGEKQRKTYSFDKFSITRDQELKIYFYENLGQRNLVITLRVTDIGPRH